MAKLASDLRCQFVLVAFGDWDRLPRRAGGVWAARAVPDGKVPEGGGAEPARAAVPGHLPSGKTPANPFG